MLFARVLTRRPALASLACGCAVALVAACGSFSGSDEASTTPQDASDAVAMQPDTSSIDAMPFDAGRDGDAADSGPRFCDTVKGAAACADFDDATYGGGGLGAFVQLDGGTVAIVHDIFLSEPNAFKGSGTNGNEGVVAVKQGEKD